MQHLMLVTVSSPRELKASHDAFVRGLAKARTRARKLVRQTTYWVYDPSAKTFSPSKFSGYVGMDFLRYEAAREGHYDGVKFDGGVTQNAIAKIVGDYQSDADLRDELQRWAEGVLGPDVLDDIDVGKWRFVRLPTIGVGGLAALAGGWEGSDELVEALSDARRSQGRTPPDMEDR